MSDVLEPLLLCHSSLVSSGAKVIADGILTDTIRRVYCFGLHLHKIDIRQESSRHTYLFAKIIEELGIGNYTSWSENEKIKFLCKHLKANTLSIPKDILLDDKDKETLNTFKA